IIVLHATKVQGAILYGIIGATVLAVALEAGLGIGGQTNAEGEVTNPTGWSLNIPALPEQLVHVPDFGLLGQFNLLGSVERIGIVTVILLVFSLMLADF